MAKYRFPGKALKLSGKKKVRYENWSKNCAIEDSYSCKIVRGLKIFRELFGSSEEECEPDFEGFQDGSHPSREAHQQLSDLGSVTSTPEGSSCPQDQSHREDAHYKSGKKPFGDDTAFVETPSEAGKPTLLSSTGKKTGRLRKPSRKALEGDGETQSKAKVAHARLNCSLSNVVRSSNRLVEPIRNKYEDDFTPPGIPSRSSPSPDHGGDRVSRNIALYADTISNFLPVACTRPTRRSVAVAADKAGQVAPEALKLHDKIEKLLQSPWDERIRLSAANNKVSAGAAHSVAVSKNILRKARLNLNKRTLQKIRNPVSVQHLLVQQREAGGSCGVCQVWGCWETLYNTTCCQQCTSFLSSLADKSLLQEIPCSLGCGGCQLNGISAEARCRACWLCQALLACTLPSLQHDRLRKRLPSVLKQKVPTSLARSVCASEAYPGKLSTLSPIGLDASAGMFGCVVDLPGGWKRKTGPEVVVIAPSGERFKSIPKLEEYLLRLGVCADARVLFGGCDPAAVGPKGSQGSAATDLDFINSTSDEGKLPKKKKKKKKKKHKSRCRSKDEARLRAGSNGATNNNCITTTLPGGWVRRTVFRQSNGRARFDVYVFSPDGRTFRSRKHLAAYFQQIGKVDDVNKYFPLFHERRSPTATSGELTESSTEPESRPESVSEVLSETDENEVLSPAASDHEEEGGRDAVPQVVGSPKEPLLDVSCGDASHEDFVGFESKCPAVQIESVETPVDTVKRDGTTGDISCDNNSSVDIAKSKRISISFPIPVEQSIYEVCQRVEHKEPPKFKAFQTQHLDGGWSRKIKWNQEGVGKVSFVVTPAGSKIHSNLELQAYFKKEGGSTLDAAKYFPNQLRREDVPANVIPSPRVFKLKQNVVKRDKKKQQLCDVTAVSSVDGGVLAAPLPVEASPGPRIKRVCRSLEQALGMPRATFPPLENKDPGTDKDGEADKDGGADKEIGAENVDTADKGKADEGGADKENKDVLETESSGSAYESATSAATSDAPYDPSNNTNNNNKKKKLKKQAKVYSVTLTAAGKVLRKTMWCNRCTGCLVPNCRKCAHCLDMVKYGGPGSKKKPCVQRRCINPRLSVHSSMQAPVIPKDVPQDAPTSLPSKDAPPEGDKTSVGAKKVPAKATKRAIKKMEEMQRRAEQEEQEDLADQSWRSSRRAASAGVDLDRSVFVPQQIMRPPVENKERGDAEVSKCAAPGALVNIDYWRGCGGDLLQEGFPVLQSAPLHLTALCYTCGSAGAEEMLWCSWCCEGVHPYCLGEGEGPQSSKEEQSWVCRRCAVCHVCGASHHPSLPLHRCSACLFYYHLQCLGPGAHGSCSPPNHALWEWDLLRHLSWSWPPPPPLFSVRCDSGQEACLYSPASHPSLKKQNSCQEAALPITQFDKICVCSSDISTNPGLLDAKLTKELDTTVLTLLDDVPEFTDSNEEPVIYALPPAGGTRQDSEALDLPEVTCVTDDLGNLDLMEIEGMDLDSLIEGLDDPDDIFEDQFNDNNVIELLMNVELSSPSDGAGRAVLSMADDEYLCLGYKKIIEYTRSVELSNFRLLQMAQVELFSALGWPSVKELERKQVISYRRRGRRKLCHAEVTAPCRCDSDTDTASEGSQASSGDEEELDWPCVLRTRRQEVLEKHKDRLLLKDAQRRLCKEMEDMKLRQLKEKMQRFKKKEQKKLVKRIKVVAKRSSVDQEEQAEDDDDMWEPIPRKKKKKFKKQVKEEKLEVEDVMNEPFTQYDELFFRPPSDEEDHEDFRRTMAATWRPSNFQELDFWLAYRENLGKAESCPRRGYKRRISEDEISKHEQEPFPEDAETDTDADDFVDITKFCDRKKRHRENSPHKARAGKSSKSATRKILKKISVADQKKLKRRKKLLLMKKKRQGQQRKEAAPVGSSPDTAMMRANNWPTLTKLTQAIRTSRLRAQNGGNRPKKRRKERDISCGPETKKSRTEESEEIVLGSEGEGFILECGGISDDDTAARSYIVEVMDAGDMSKQGAVPSSDPDCTLVSRHQDDDGHAERHVEEKTTHDSNTDGDYSTLLSNGRASFIESPSTLDRAHPVDTRTEGPHSGAERGGPNEGVEGSTRSRGRVSCGRASLLASLRKARLDA